MRFFPLPDASPVLLYELRQAMRNRLILWLMGIYLASMVLFVGSGLTFKDQWIVAHILSHGIFYDNLAFQLVLGLLCAFYGFTTIVLVAFGSVRLSLDRIHEHAVLHTTLSPGRIVWGKMQFGLVLGVLFGSMTLPFIAVAYLLKGVDIRLILYGAFWFFCMTQLHYAITLVFLSGVKTMTQAAARAVPMLLLHFFLAFFFYIFLIIVVFELLPEATFFTAVLLPGLLVGLVVLLLHLLSAVQLAPENSNRMLPVRVVLTVLYGLFLCAATVGLFYHYHSSITFASLNQTLGILFFLCNFIGPFVFGGFVLVFICERDEYSARIRRSIPSGVVKRLLYFPFYTGTANAMVWITLFLLLKAAFIYPFYSLICAIIPYPVGEVVKLLIVDDFSFSLLFFDYAATTLLFYNIVFHRYYSREWNWAPLTAFYTILAVLLFFEAFFGHLTGTFLIRFFHRFLELPFLPIPWEYERYGPRFHEMPYLTAQLTIGVIWFFLLALPGFFWLRRHFADFRPLPTEGDR